MNRRQLLLGVTTFVVASQLKIPSLWRNESDPALVEDYVGSGGPVTRGVRPQPVDILLSDNEAPSLIASVSDIRSLLNTSSKVKWVPILEDVGPTARPKTSEIRKVAQSISEKVRDFSLDFTDDIFLTENQHSVLDDTLARLGRLQSLVGHGHFNVIDFDQARAYAKNYSDVGKFTEAELAFIEQMFETDASDYGFFGEKVSDALTQSIKKSEVFKVPGSGHYLYRDESLAHYEKLVKDVGDDVILTSGIRSNVKQIHLFLAKSKSVSYNLSRASRSLAPPGYSFHGIGDYDVGKKGWGALNFTGDFAKSDTFKKMQDLGYVQIRYLPENELGVRFEPWHIKVV